MVHESSDIWHTVDHIWLSNGETYGKATVQVQIKLQEEEGEEE